MCESRNSRLILAEAIRGAKSESFRATKVAVATEMSLLNEEPRETSNGGFRQRIGVPLERKLRF